MKGAGITIVGLGPGDPEHLTREAWTLIQSASEIYLRTRQHPVVPALPSDIKIHSFDAIYEEASSFEAVYTAIIEKILELGQRKQGVVYAVPGHPFIAESTGPEIVRRARAAGTPVKVVEGLSFIEPLQTALGLDPFPQTVLVDAFQIATAYQLPFEPHQPSIIAQVYNQSLAADLKLTLMSRYPDDHPVKLVHAAGTSDQLIEAIPLWQIDQSEYVGLLTALYLPALAGNTGLPVLADIVARLRAPDGCPWDQEQTHESMRVHLIEETYEVIDAIDAGDDDMLAEELGDLLFQIVFHAQLGYENEAFNLGHVISGIAQKLIRRHPHVFGDLEISTKDELLKNWERLKSEERAQEPETEKGMLDGLPAHLPALAQSQGYQERAARVGFDWPDVSGVYAKLAEELDEFKRAENQSDRIAEIGDLLFVVVRLAGWYDIDSEMALREANRRFKSRFRYLEAQARHQSRELRDYSLEGLNQLWDQAKRLEE
jgi:tetrapyrrole methylase family protein/MazG family protein